MGNGIQLRLFYFSFILIRLQREQQQKTGARAANSAHITPPQAATGSTTPPNVMPSQFTSQVRCQTSESSATTINSSNNVTDSSSSGMFCLMIRFYCLLLFIHSDFIEFIAPTHATVSPYKMSHEPFAI